MRAWRFVEGYPALVVEGGGGYLVVSDLHIGIEEELRNSGIYVPAQTGAILRDLESVSRLSGASRLVLLGDVKHTVIGMTPYELQEVRRLAEWATSAFDEVIIVPGNHDGGLALPGFSSVKFADPRGIVVESGGARVGLAHGHARIPDYMRGVQALVVGHNHLYLGAGPGERYQVWVRCVGCGGFGELIVMPAFNRLLGGAAIGELGEGTGPALRLVLENGDRAEVYLLDGHYLGTLSSLRDALLVEED